MTNLSDNYYNREYFLKSGKVPTQSVIANNMGRPLANVYFKSMNYKRKILAGLEPPLRGGGSDWYMPPDEILKGNVALKPEKKVHLAKLGSDGIIHFGELLISQYRRNMEKEKQIALKNTDTNWKQIIEVACKQYWDDCSKVAAERNTEAMQKAFREFTTMFNTSITKIEALLLDSSVNEITTMKQEAYDKMKQVLKERVEFQANRIHRQYNDQFNKEKFKRKDRFIKKIEKARALMAAEIHDLRVEKHVVVEKLRHFLQAQNLACRVYVALIERDECKKEMDASLYEHKKKVERIKEELALKDFEIRLAQKKEKKRDEFNTIWKRKVCHVVKRLQLFVTYCLNSLPEHADFFINMEKLMLLHISKVIENPEVESIFELDNQHEFHTPVPKPHPFYLVCDKGDKPKIDEDLCPKHCTSSASHMPVVIVNKRCIYAACDNFEEFTSKITEFIHGHRGDDIDFQDLHDYSPDVPVKYTSQEQFKELKLESSLLQIFQKERPNLFSYNVECCSCIVPHCFCQENGVKGDKTPSKDENKAKSNDPDTMSVKSGRSAAEPSVKANISEESICSGIKIQTREDELLYERGPNIQSYMEYILPMKCKCAKTARKHLAQLLPPYMVGTSKYESLDLPNYERCSLATLKKLVRRAQGKSTPQPTPPEIIPPKRDMETQYSDQQFDQLCTCFSDDEVEALFKKLAQGAEEAEAPKVVRDKATPSYLTRRASSFATECAYDLRNILDDSSQLQEIFRKKNCDFKK